MKRKGPTPDDNRDAPRKRSRENVAMEEPSQSASSQLCRNGCGFYGTAQNEGMCSKCYKETVQKNSGSGRKSPSPRPLSSVKTDIPTTPNSLSSKERHSEVAVSSSMAALATSDSLSKNCSEVASTSSATPSTPVRTSVTHVPMTSDINSSSENQEDDTTSANSSPASSSPATPCSDDSPSKPPPKKNRCATCRKRIGLTGFSCRCGKSFCAIHRYSDQHNCDYDYRADAQAKIRKENPVVIGEKVQKI